MEFYWMELLQGPLDGLVLTTDGPKEYEPDPSAYYRVEGHWYKPQELKDGILYCQYRGSGDNPNPR